MLGSALCYSLVPLLVASAGGAEFPLVFNFFYRLGGFAGGAFVLVLLGRRRGVGLGLVNAMASNLRPWNLILLLQFFGFTFFAWSVRYVDAAVTTMVYEAWPVVFMLLMGVSVGERRWFQRLTWRQAGLALLCLLGVCLVVDSQDGVAVGVSVSVALGVGIAVGGMLLISMSYLNYRWVAAVVTTWERDHGTPAGVGLWFEAMFWIYVVGSLVSFLLNGGFSLALERDAWTAGSGFFKMAPVVFVAAAVVDVGGTVFNRWANLTTDRISVNVVHYATPVMGVLWLFALGLVGVEYELLLALGVLLITGANILLFIESARR